MVRSLSGLFRRRCAGFKQRQFYLTPVVDVLFNQFQCRWVFLPGQQPGVDAFLIALRKAPNSAVSP